MTLKSLGLFFTSLILTAITFGQTENSVDITPHWKNSEGSGRQSHANLNLSRMLFRVTYNEQGFVQAGHCCLSSPELKPNKEIKVQDNN